MEHAWCAMSGLKDLKSAQLMALSVSRDPGKHPQEEAEEQGEFFATLLPKTLLSTLHPNPSDCCACTHTHTECCYLQLCLAQCTPLFRGGREKMWARGRGGTVPCIVLHSSRTCFHLWLLLLLQHCDLATLRV